MEARAIWQLINILMQVALSLRWETPCVSVESTLMSQLSIGFYFLPSRGFRDSASCGCILLLCELTCMIFYNKQIKVRSKIKLKIKMS